MSTCSQCGKGNVVMVDALHSPSAVEYDFVCSRGCGWQSADLERARSGRKIQKKAQKKHSKRVEPQVDSEEFVAVFRAEVQRRMEILILERAKFPPKFIKKGKKLVVNPKFTPAMRRHMHKFYVDAVEIRQELLNA